MDCQLFEELGLREFWQEALGAVPWEKVVELLAVNRLIAPRSELFIQEKWVWADGGHGAGKGTVKPWL
jgi:hypothetical protein